MPTAPILGLVIVTLLIVLAHVLCQRANRRGNRRVLGVIDGTMVYHGPKCLRDGVEPPRSASEIGGDFFTYRSLPVYQPGIRDPLRGANFITINSKNQWCRRSPDRHHHLNEDGTTCIHCGMQAKRFE